MNDSEAFALVKSLTAARIVSCVNACKYLPQEFLESLLNGLDSNGLAKATEFVPISTQYGHHDDYNRPIGWITNKWPERLTKEDILTWIKWVETSVKELVLDENACKIGRHPASQSFCQDAKHDAQLLRAYLRRMAKDLRKQHKREQREATNALANIERLAETIQESPTLQEAKHRSAETNQV